MRLYEQEETDERCYFTMQLLEGLPLRKVVGLRREREQRFTVREVEPIFNQITMALGHAHRHTVHGNLKPENILILPDVLKLTDVGSYAFVDRARFVAAQQEAGRGGYLAPELLAGDALTRQADIYSLGALLYELLTGKPFGPEAMPVSKVLDKPDEAPGRGASIASSPRPPPSRPRRAFEGAEASPRPSAPISTPASCVWTSGPTPPARGRDP
ncbi:MAG: protein kinase [bacterium]